MSERFYLGDGVYISNNRHVFVLTTDDEQGRRNTIFLDVPTFVHLQTYVTKQLEADSASTTTQQPQVIEQLKNTK